MAKKGQKAGSKSSQGYLYVKVNQKSYSLHRLAWLFCYEENPTEIDHINGVRDDNRVKNLREVNRRANGLNKYFHRNGKLAYALKHKGKWISRVGQVRLGIYKTELMAHKVAMKYVKKYKLLKIIKRGKKCL